jgi:enamine deaminase RidA (YjgF/YER057c/UK114 family)
MLMNLIEGLSELGHTMPPLGAPAANYVQFTRDKDLLVISGQIGTPGAAAAGPVGAGLSLQAAVEADALIWLQT